MYMKTHMYVCTVYHNIYICIYTHEVYKYYSAAVWRWIGSLRVFCLCVYSFVICWSHLVVFGTHFAILLSLGRLWASFWEPLGRLGLPRGPPWRHFGPPLAPVGLRGAICGTFGSQGELGMTLGPKWTSNSEQMALK